jgi:hypothetical protein
MIVGRQPVQPIGLYDIGTATQNQINLLWVTKNSLFQTKPTDERKWFVSRQFHGLLLATSIPTTYSLPQHSTTHCLCPTLPYAPLPLCLATSHTTTGFRSVFWTQFVKK